ncbi:Panacea domain-containing protein [Escherichia coli]|nr:Panacea domain-containing protein [Escherichia coli]
MLNVRFDSEKALEAILYVASKAPIPDIYHVGKILYYADRFHLESFGRLITGDHYNAMKDGPVASNTYDIIKLLVEMDVTFLMVVMSILCEKHFLYQV